MPKNRSYRYFVKPLGDNINEVIAELLTARHGRTEDVEVQKIIVNNKPIYGVYRVDHNVLTELGRTVHANRIRVYSQENEGEIRPYTLYKRTVLSRTRAIRDIEEKLAKLKRK